MVAKLSKIIALGLALASAPAAAQQSVPYFPQTLPSGSVVGRLSSGPGPTEAISMSALLAALFPSGPAASTFNANSVVFNGSVSGSVTVQAQAAAGSWSLQWPTSQGFTGACFTETVSGSIATTSWTACPSLSGNNTWAGAQTFNGNLAIGGTANFTGPFQIGGVAQTFPSGQIVGTSDAQVLTNKSIDGSEINSGVIGASHGGAGTTTGALKGDGSGNVSAAGCSDLSNDGPYCAAAAGQMPGIAGSTAASAGNIGELMTSTVLVGSAVALTSTNPANVTSLSLTAGDWDVWGVVWLAPAGTTTSTLQQAWISLTSATQPTVPGTTTSLTQFRFSTAAGLGVNIPTTAVPISVASTTSVFLEAQSVFATSTMGAYGTIWARRRR